MNPPKVRLIFFTMHRSGSTLLHRVCGDLCRAGGLGYASPNPGGDQHIGIRQFCQTPPVVAWRADCVGPLRVFAAPPDMPAAQIVLQLRDPRDVLTSMYYSYCYSHIGAEDPGTGDRQRVADQGIDEFVLKMSTATAAPFAGDYGTGCHLWDLAGNVVQRYQTYLDHLVGRPNVLLLSYEQAMAAPQAWLVRLAAVFGVDAAAPILQDITAREFAAGTLPAENIHAHRRIATPGDHRTKLKPDTIAQLNLLYQKPLQVLGYV